MDQYLNMETVGQNGICMCLEHLCSWLNSLDVSLMMVLANEIGVSVDPP